MSQLSWWSVTRMQLHNHKHTIYRCSKGSILWHAEAAMNWVVHEFHRYRHLYSRCKTCRAAAKLTADQIFLVVRGLEARQSVGGSVLVLVVEVVESQTRAGGRQTRSFIRNVSKIRIFYRNAFWTNGCWSLERRSSVLLSKNVRLWSWWAPESRIQSNVSYFFRSTLRNQALTNRCFCRRLDAAPSESSGFREDSGTCYIQCCFFWEFLFVAKLVLIHMKM